MKICTVCFHRTATDLGWNVNGLVSHSTHYMYRSWRWNVKFPQMNQYKADKLVRATKMYDQLEHSSWDCAVHRCSYCKAHYKCTLLFAQCTAAPTVRQTTMYSVVRAVHRWSCCKAHYKCTLLFVQCTAAPLQEHTTSVVCCYSL